MKLHQGIRRWAGGIATAVLCMGLTGCAKRPPDMPAYDPLESMNRHIYNFNEDLDRAVIGPVSRGYAAITPHAVRLGVGNFFSNAAYPGVVLNDFLQGKGAQGLQDSCRFLVNTTLGLLGFFNPASSMGLPDHNEDFGQTLGVWGSGPGAYLMLPVLGPSDGRDVTSLPVGVATDVATYASPSWPVSIGLVSLRIINTRAELEKAVQIRETAAIDPYLFTRSAYLQQRYNAVYDGHPPQSDSMDDQLFKELEENSPAPEKNGNNEKNQ